MSYSPVTLEVELGIDIQCVFPRMQPTLNPTLLATLAPGLSSHGLAVLSPQNATMLYTLITAQIPIELMLN